MMKTIANQKDVAVVPGINLIDDIETKNITNVVADTFSKQQAVILKIVTILEHELNDDSLEEPLRDALEASKNVLYNLSEIVTPQVDFTAWVNGDT